MTKCDPCESLEKSHLLSEEDVATLLQSEQLSHRWKIGKKQMGGDEYSLFISRKFTAKNFQAAMDYFNQIASIAEREGHHPDFVSVSVTGTTSLFFKSCFSYISVSCFASLTWYYSNPTSRPVLQHLTSYRDVEVVLSTHSVGGVTRNDIILAKMLDEEVSIEYSPKWLRDNP